MNRSHIVDKSVEKDQSSLFVSDLKSANDQIEGDFITKLRLKLRQGVIKVCTHAITP